jgi:hypothetical protein
MPSQRAALSRRCVLISFSNLTKDTLILLWNRLGVESGILRLGKCVTGRQSSVIVTVCNIFAQKASRPLFSGVLERSGSRVCCFYRRKGLAS